MNDYDEGDTTQYDPIIVKLTGDLSGDFFQGNNYEYKTNELVSGVADATGSQDLLE